MNTLAHLPRWPRLLWTLALAPAVLLLRWRCAQLTLRPGLERELFALLRWWGQLRGTEK